MDVWMIIFLILFLIVIFYKSKIVNDWGNSFTDKTQSIVLRGICCVIVVIVHIPKLHGNIIQDAIGSFAYVCVTIFFMLSAYGLKYSLKNKKNYLKNFIRNRFLVIYIPYIMANILEQVINFKNGFDFWKIIGINKISFVGELIIFYLLFYIIYRNIKNQKKADYLMIISTFVISIVTYIFKFGWYVECLGFAYGIIYFDLEKKINKSITEKYWFKLIMSLLLSLVAGIIYLRVKNILIVNYLSKIMLGIIIIILVYSIMKKIKICNKFIYFLGNISYEIFLLHNIIIQLFINLDVPSGIYIMIVLTTTIICSYFMNFVDKKITELIRGKKLYKLGNGRL